MQLAEIRKLRARVANLSDQAAEIQTEERGKVRKKE